MAKFGEGDSRWIVTDLGKKGQNVNNWHWTEKDALPWIRGELEKEFPEGENLLKSDVLEITSNGIEKLTGEAVVANRKGRLRVFYSMNLQIKVKGVMSGPDGNKIMESEGILKLPYFCDTEDCVEDYGIEFSISKGPQTLRKMFFKEKKKFEVLDKKLSLIIEKLKKGGPVADLQSPSSNKNNNGEEEEEEGEIKNVEAEKKNVIKKKMDDDVVEKILKSDDVTDKKPTDFRIRIKHLFPIPLPLLYECFTKPERMSFYTQSKCIINSDKTFSWYNGVITGKIIKEEENKLIEMKWRFNDWVKDKHSRVFITFGKDDKSGKSFVQLVQRHVPECDKFGNPVKQKLLTGWKQRFFHKIGYMFGTKMSSRMFF